MATLFLVRHGRAAAGFDGHLDPGLDDLGRMQAHSAAAILAPLGPLAIYSSPLARARETAIPLSQRWGIEPVIEHRVAEIPSPTDDLRAARGVAARGHAGSLASAIRRSATVAPRADRAAAADIAKTASCSATTSRSTSRSAPPLPMTVWSASARTTARSRESPTTTADCASSNSAARARRSSTDGR